MLLAAAIFNLIWRYRETSPFPSFLFLSLLSLAVLARLFLETFRGDSVLVTGGIRQVLLAAMIVLPAALWLMRQWASNAIPSSAEIAAEID